MNSYINSLIDVARVSEMYLNSICGSVQVLLYLRCVSLRRYYFIVTIASGRETYTNTHTDDGYMCMW